MILDLDQFIRSERSYWDELDGFLARVENDPSVRLTLPEVTRFHYLYQRCAADLTRIRSFAARTHASEWLEHLVARAYAELNDLPSRRRFSAASAWRWLSRTFPQTFRRRFPAFALSLTITVLSAGLGAAVLAVDSKAKPVLMPFPQLLESPADRVKREESAKVDRLTGLHGAFSAQLMTHNIQVSLGVLAMGMTWGIGTALLLFYNGVTLGAIALDYVRAGYISFLLGWLLPHGVVEIPAILISGQAGFLLANALIGWGDAIPRRSRLRAIAPDVLTLTGGAAVMLVWAGIVEAFLSQYHAPILPYGLKIGFGCLELALLILFLARGGRN